MVLHAFCINNMFYPFNPDEIVITLALGRKKCIIDIIYGHVSFHTRMR